MSERFKTANRCYLIDHHSPQPPIVPLGKMEIEEYERFIETAKVNSLMVYCKDHWGVTYYDSKVPGAQKHRGVEGDWIRAVRDLTAKKNIEFMAYYCIEYDEGTARSFPEWRVKKADGSYLIRDDLYAKWSVMCYYTDYREFAISQLEEIIVNYHPDSLFLDILGASLCYCDACKSKFREQFHYELPETEEELILHKKDVISFLDRKAGDFLAELSARLKKIDPEIAITGNFACHYPNFIRRMMDFQYSEPLMKDNWFSSAYARDTAVGQYPMLAPGEASAVYNYDKPEQYIADLSAIAAQGCRVGMYSGSQHIDGTLEHEESRRLGAVYQELEKMNKYFTLTRKPVKAVGILQSDVTKTAGNDPIVPDAILRMKKHSPHTHAILGAMMACEQAKIPYSVLPENDVTADLLKEYELVLLPEVYVVLPSVLEALKSYVSGGGKLIISGRSGTLDEKGNQLERCVLNELTGCTYIKEHDEYRQNDWSAYIQACEPDAFKGLLKVTTPPVSDFFMEVQPDTAQTIAKLCMPCVACTPSEWVNWWSPPPGETTAMPAISLNQLDKGQVIYLAFDYFTMSASESFRDTAELFGDLLEIFRVRPALKNVTDIPNILRTAFFEEETYYQIHQISTIPSRFRGETPYVSGGSIVSKVPISRAELVYPEKKELSVVKEGEGWKIDLPELNLQQMALLYK